MISGCKDNQTSTDASIQGRSSGAMTFSFIAAFNLQQQQFGNAPLSYLTLLQSMRRQLKSTNFPQLPQLSAGRPMNMQELLYF